MKLLVKILIVVSVFGLCGFKSSNEPYRIVFAGDSITDGAWGGSNGTKRPTTQRNHEDLNHIYGHSYMMLCAARLGADNPDKFYFYNRGISGNTLADLEARWDEDILQLNPDIISILIGTNDVYFHLKDHSDEAFDYAEWEKRYRKILDEAKEKNPNVIFIIGTPFGAKSGKIGEGSDYETRVQMINELDEIVCNIASDYNAKLIRFDEVFANQLKKYPNVAPSYWIWDGIHPTPAGHQLMADEWLKTYKEIQLN